MNPPTDRVALMVDVRGLAVLLHGTGVSDQTVKDIFGAVGIHPWLPCVDAPPAKNPLDEGIIVEMRPPFRLADLEPHPDKLAELPVRV